MASSSKKAVTVLSQERVSRAKALGDALGDALVSIEYGLGLHGEDVGVIQRAITDVRKNMATKDDITALAKLVTDGFNSLGINIANGDHRIGRPVR